MAELHDTMQSIHRSLDIILKFLNIPNPNLNKTDASVGILDSKSEIEESTTQIRDFKVVESEEAIPIPLGSDEEADDSLEFELIPPFFFVDNEEADSLEDLIPSYFFAEDVDSIAFELIPHFFFIENADVDSLQGIAKLEITDFSEPFPIKIDRIKDIEIQFCVKVFEENSDISKSLMESLVLHKKLLQMDCLGLRFDYHRFFFDRGKCPVISSPTYAKLLLHLRLNLGYDSNLRFINLVPRLCPTDVTTVCAKKMFVQMSKSKKHKLLLHLFARVITIESSCANLARSKDIIVLENKLNCKDYVTLLFDRGKEIELSLRTCVTECFAIVLTIDIYLKLLGDCYRILVPELIPEHDYWSASWSLFVSSATWQMLDKIFEIDIVCLKSNNVSSVQSLIDGRVFDRGKAFVTSPGCSYFTGGCEFSSGLPASCLFVLHVCSFLKDATKRNLTYKLFLRHEFRSHSSSMNYIWLVFKTSILGKKFLGCFQMLAMCRTVIFLLQLEFCLFHEISVHCLDSLVVNQIHFVSFVCVFKVLMFNTFTILHHGLLYLQSWSLFHIVVWIHMDQGTWVNQIAGTSAFFSQASSQMSQLVSSAGVFSYGKLIFVLIPSLGYHSYCSAIHLHILLCIIDADIVDVTLTATMDARTGILSHLAESFARGLRGGDAITFLLSELWEIRAREQEHKEWLPKPTAVNLLVCDDAHILLTLLTIILTKVYFFIYTILFTSICGSLPATEYIRFIFDRGKAIENVEMWSSYASNLSKLYFTSCLFASDGLKFTDPCGGKSAPEIYFKVEKHCNTRNQNFKVYYFYMFLTEFPSYTNDFSKIYFCIYILQITSARNISKFYFTSFLIFTDAYDGKSTHELTLEFEYYLVLFFGILNVLEFVVNGERSEARQLVSAMLQQVYIPWSILILHLSMTRDLGGIPDLHVFHQFCLFARSNGDNKYFVVASGYPTPSTQQIWTPLQVSTSLGMPFLEQATTVYSTFSTKDLRLQLYLLVSLLRKNHLGAFMRGFFRYWVNTFVSHLHRVAIGGVENLHQLISPKSNADMDGGVDVSTYPASLHSPHVGLTAPHNQIQGTDRLYKTNFCLVVISLAVCFANRAHDSRNCFYLPHWLIYLALIKMAVLKISTMLQP